MILGDFRARGIFAPRKASGFILDSFLIDLGYHLDIVFRKILICSQVGVAWTYYVSFVESDAGVVEIS